ncbi:redox-sensitive transcriptional activator SoxR [Pseudonocardiaceae bacterium YIM PH 21723]|nr:redox-sensitive transcriptional activator SoxR [Pseudonocardiaceae bacterium YIM PH 21723]
MPTMGDMHLGLSIGEVTARSGVARTALRFYEDKGLIHSERTAGNQRRYPRVVLRRLAFIQAAQRAGVELSEIREALDTLPDRRVPSKADWARLGTVWQAKLDARIEALTRLRNQLTSCIGCGCLSLKSCGIYNTGDEMAAYGPGAPRLRIKAQGGKDPVG